VVKELGENELFEAKNRGGADGFYLKLSLVLLNTPKEAYPNYLQSQRL